MWPKKLWYSLYEPAIRMSAGLGKSPTQPDPELYDHNHLHCDVLVVGGGVSGIIAASISSDCGNNTVLMMTKLTCGSTIFQDDGNFKINDEISSIWLNNQIKN